jgi:hypothetical protein
LFFEEKFDIGEREWKRQPEDPRTITPPHLETNDYLLYPTTMLAHLKAKHREYGITAATDGSPSLPSVEEPTAVGSSQTDVERTPGPPPSNMTPDDEKSATQMTCDVLCSLGASSYPASSTGMMTMMDDSPCGGDDDCDDEDDMMYESMPDKRKSKSSCPKQHQLPMFLSSEYKFRRRNVFRVFHLFVGIQSRVTNLFIDVVKSESGIFVCSRKFDIQLVIHYFYLLFINLWFVFRRGTWNLDRCFSFVRFHKNRDVPHD